MAKITATVTIEDQGKPTGDGAVFTAEVDPEHRREGYAGLYAGVELWAQRMREKAELREAFRGERR